MVAGLASGGYGVAEAARNGMYASAAVGALLLAAGAYRLLSGEGPQAQPSQGGSARQRENLAIAEGLLHDQRFAVGEIRLDTARAPLVLPVKSPDIGDFVEGMFDFVNFLRSLREMQRYSSLIRRAAAKVAELGAPGRLFEARLEYWPGWEDPGTRIKVVGRMIGIGFPSAGPGAGWDPSNPAVWKVWLIIRASSGSPPVGPGIERLIRYPHELGLTQEIYISADSI
ncbi:MAG: hypothetical protein KatS3mg077_2018 [Candidatus Binatia bacterium]|nr:MAG: hypothetical protein KatS3mg077_2018 [Candidatus Binatia bacterium]